MYSGGYYIKTIAITTVISRINVTIMTIFHSFSTLIYPTNSYDTCLVCKRAH